MPTGQEILIDVEDLKKMRKKYLKGKIHQGINKQEFNQHMQMEFSELHDNYKTVFEKVMDGSFDKPEEFERLRMFLQMKDRVDSKQVSEHNASVAIGQHLVDKYVKPTIGNNPPTEPAPQVESNDTDQHIIM